MIKKRYPAAALVALFMCACFLTSGCGAPTPSEIQVLVKTGTQEIVSVGLGAITDPVKAKLCANLVIDNVAAARGVMTGTLPTSQVLQDLLSLNLLNGLPLEVSLAIRAASLVLSEYVQVPSATTYLTPNEVTYVNAALDGIQAAAQAFIASGGKPMVRKIRGQYVEMTPWFKPPVKP